MTTVFISGLGLIGSSLARIIKKKEPAINIIATDTNQAALTFAKRHGLIDENSPDLGPASQADFIILATPVAQIIADIQQLAQLPLKPHVIVTDVGSTKATIMTAANQLTAKGINFIGGHPMAGSHLTGVRAGRADLFKNTYYFQIPTMGTAGLTRVRSLLEVADVKWTTITAADHDKLVAQISHLPHILAYTLVNQAASTLDGQHPGIKAAAGGFRSMTRTAQADPTMWTAIMQNNRTAIVHQLNDYIAELSTVRDAIDGGRLDRLQDFFTQAQQTRRKLERGE